jgi:Flp pilus assembly protein TadG
LGRLWRDAQGSVAIIFALSAVALIAFLGAGLDLSRAYVARQELSNVATLTCQYSNRPLVYEVAYSNNNGVATYAAQVNAFATQSLANQNFKLTQTNATPFTYAALGSTAQVNLAASMPTLFLPIVAINSIPVTVTVTCSTGQTQPTPPAGTVVLSESFENAACSGTCWGAFQPNGTNKSFISTPVQSFPSTVGYVGASGAEWTIMGYCLEIDASGVIRSTSADGTHAAELNCDNGSGTAGVSSISNKTYYAVGTYELRYYFSGRVGYPDYDPAYICGSTAADVSWANSTNSSGGPVSNALRNNQVGVYFDADQNGVAPTHTPTVSGVTLAGSNLVDVCVTSTGWIQRSVKITVTTAGYYWLSFAADGQNDSYGADIDAIQVCVTACSGSVQDNFPSAWTSTPLLFEDTFESPSYSGNSQVTENLNTSYGTTGSGAGGWPGQGSTGWATGPYNQAEYIRSSFAGQGSQSIQLDSSKLTGQTTSRRSISRYFYLDPGYYEIQYDYTADVRYTAYVGPTCTAAPSSLSAYVLTLGLLGTDRVAGGGSITYAPDTNAVAVFMSHSLEASYPNGGGSQDSATSYTNPDGSTSTTPTVAPDGLTLSSYNGSQVNPVLDYCNYSSSWATRTTYVKITKPGQYWLTISSQGTADKHGGAIDDVRLTALNSLYGSAPSFSVAIPTPTPTNGSSVSFTGFSVLADPLTP